MSKTWNKILSVLSMKHFIQHMLQLQKQQMKNVITACKKWCDYFPRNSKDQMTPVTEVQTIALLLLFKTQHRLQSLSETEYLGCHHSEDCTRNTQFQPQFCESLVAVFHMYCVKSRFYYLCSFNRPDSQ